MRTNFSIDSIDVLRIKQAVETRYGKRPNSPADFAELSLHIQKDTAGTISPDTLSRLWGYKKGYPTVRRSCIDILNAYAHAGEESDFVYQIAVKATETKAGERVKIAWQPDRTCLLEYLGDYQWRVVESEHSKLKAGDSFSCRVIAQGQTLVVDHLHTANGVYDGYVIGNTNGLTLVLPLGAGASAGSGATAP